MNLSTNIHRWSLVAVVAIIAAVAILAPAPPAKAAPSIPQDCLNGMITLHKDKDFGGGAPLKFYAGLEWSYMADGWNDVISSACVPGGSWVTLFQDRGFSGVWTTLDARGSSTPKIWTSLSWYWNDMTSSFKSGR